MRGLIVIFFVFIANVSAQMLSADRMAILMRYHRECQAQTGISDSAASGVITGRFPNDPVLMRHLLCIHQRLGIQDRNGILQRDAISSMLRSALPASADVNGIVNTCAVQKSTGEETALNMDRCMYGMVRSRQG
ncbi:hypothetical protein JTB14_017205 [Gonioctena quinquepunctata]|nr:hypothetical protein JTB14_017205 [Gonioctena quinquepunctata]